MADRLLLLCHDARWDRLYQAASCAAAASAQGDGVDMVFYFGALEKLIDGRLDEFTPAQEMQRFAQSSQEIGTRSVSELLSAARSAGDLRIYACSASIALLGRSVAAAKAVVDEVIGWPTVLRMLGKTRRVLYL
jgi:peroxiredoxin family protein